MATSTNNLPPGLIETIEELFKTKNLYEVLGTTEDADPAMIKKAYRKTSLKVHPDRAEPQHRKLATKKFQALLTVYNVLSDKSARTLYDKTAQMDETTFMKIIRSHSINDIAHCYYTCTMKTRIETIESMFKDKVMFLVISMEGHEIVNLLNPRGKYEYIFAENVPRIYRATGGLLKKSPIVYCVLTCVNTMNSKFQKY